ncbi:hypothetical protein Bbelb_129050 [Branchiostoma belcheri]|nr:hypothetical protein Bbelb_129050 [Branchiostoma belcheri]
MSLSAVPSWSSPPEIHLCARHEHRQTAVAKIANTRPPDILLSPPSQTSSSTSPYTPHQLPNLPAKLTQKVRSSSGAGREERQDWSALPSRPAEMFVSEWRYVCSSRDGETRSRTSVALGDVLQSPPEAW